MTREQKRASDAAHQVQWVVDNLGAKKKEYNTLVHALPAWIRANGLLQAVAFLQSKAPARIEYQTLLDHLRQHFQAARLQPREGLLSGSLVDLPYDQYARWQEEAVRCAAWLKRFAAALIGAPEDGGQLAGTESSATEAPGL
jgi:CRISPR type III-B/RAMP module-associated protein Cmr5